MEAACLGIVYLDHKKVFNVISTKLFGELFQFTKLSLEAINLVTEISQGNKINAVLLFIEVSQNDQKY